MPPPPSSPLSLLLPSPPSLSPPPLSPPSTPMAECPELQFTLDLKRLTGKIGHNSCYQVVPNFVPYSAADEAVCTSYFVDPSDKTPTAPDEYPFDCSLGCRKCEYKQGTQGFGCRSTAEVISKCSPPPVFWLDGEVGAAC
eukprot:scaffold33281_cov124-Isochrysis_galbana.AAC.2